MADPLQGSKCIKLTPEQADNMFFPGPGKKVNGARKFCEDCTIEGKCLLNAIRQDLDGFWAGTTKKERTSMRNLVKEIVSLEDFLPQEKKLKGKRERPLVTHSDHYSYLDNIEPTIEELNTLV